MYPAQLSVKAKPKHRQELPQKISKQNIHFCPLHTSDKKNEMRRRLLYLSVNLSNKHH